MVDFFKAIMGFLWWMVGVVIIAVVLLMIIFFTILFLFIGGINGIFAIFT